MKTHSKNLRIRRKFYVSISKPFTSIVVLAENSDEARTIGIQKMFGRQCFWFANYSLPGYGQVFQKLRSTKRNSNPGNSAVTYQTYLEIYPLAKKSRAFLKQEKLDQIEADEIQKHIESEYCGWDAGFRGLPIPTDVPKYKFDYDDGYERGKHDRLEHEIKWAEEEKYQHELLQKREQAEKLEQEKIFQEKLDIDLAETTQRRKQIQEIVIAEIDRLKKIDLSQPIEDITLLQLIRNTIAIDTFVPGSMPLGKWKKILTNGQYPDLISNYLNSIEILQKMENKIKLY